MRSLLHGVLLLLLFASMLLLLPIILPFAFFSNARERRQLLAAVEGFTCVMCGTNLDKEAIRLADEKHGEWVSSLRANGIRMRIGRTCVAICPSCDALYRSGKDTGTIQLMSSEEIA